MFFIGNKCGLDNDRVVSKEHGKSIADELSGGRVGHHETSAKNNINVKEVRFILYLRYCNFDYYQKYTLSCI